MKWTVTNRVAGERSQRLPILTAPFVRFHVAIVVKPHSPNFSSERGQPCPPEVRLGTSRTMLSPLRLGSASRAICFNLCAALLAMVTFVSSATEVRPERWRWSNPLPHGNNVLDMLVTTDVAVQVGDGGTVYVQRSDERWAPAVTGVTNYLRGVALMDERVVVVGENGCILWSDDGNYFQRAQLSPTTSDWFEGVTASAQRTIAVGDNGSIYSSTNGQSWSKVASGTAEWLRGIAFGNGAYVAVGENGKILRSTVGSSWSSIISGTTAHLNRVRYLGSSGSGQFIAVGNGGVALSSATGTAP